MVGSRLHIHGRVLQQFHDQEPGQSGGVIPGGPCRAKLLTVLSGEAARYQIPGRRFGSKSGTRRPLDTKVELECAAALAASSTAPSKGVGLTFLAIKDYDVVGARRGGLH
jgi:hypothetical protein